MDLEATPIQIQTPPKDDEMETPPEPADPIEPFDMVERPDGEEEEQEIAEEAHDDEIVVEDAVHEVEVQNGDNDQESPLSSDPESDADIEASKNGKISHVSSM
jgi:hypothetical protein